MDKPQEIGEEYCRPCVAAHPLHCCHTVRAVRRDGRAGWRCVDCGKESRAWVPVTSREEPRE
jgi:hypothetical protein